MRETKRMRNSQYTKEFRDETVELIFNSEKSAVQIARDLGINEKMSNELLKLALRDAI